MAQVLQEVLHRPLLDMFLRQFYSFFLTDVKTHGEHSAWRPSVQMTAR
jgi:hypothetical protein